MSQKFAEECLSIFVGYNIPRQKIMNLLYKLQDKVEIFIIIFSPITSVYSIYEIEGLQIL